MSEHRRRQAAHARATRPRGDAAATRATCIGENPVTGFAFGLFVLIVLAALLGPYIVPYDPLASNTAIGAEAALARALVRHRPARPRHVQPRDRRPPGSTSSSRSPRWRWCS